MLTFASDVILFTPAEWGNRKKEKKKEAVKEYLDAVLALFLGLVGAVAEALRHISKR